MKIIVLSDNQSDNPQLLAEHGLSVLLETPRSRILLDTGASDVFMRNASCLGIDITHVDVVFISHGHNDHAGGLRYFMKINQKAKVIVSPDALKGVFFSKRNLPHSITPQWPDDLHDRVIAVEKTYEVDGGLRVLTQIPQIYPLPRGNKHLYVQDAAGNLVPDDFRHELALYADGLLFTGCAHSGLENILAACPWPIHTVVGGFHLLDGLESDEELTLMAQRLIDQYPHTQFYTSHCTGCQAFQTMKRVMGERLQAFSCGMQIQC